MRILPYTAVILACSSLLLGCASASEKTIKQRLLQYPHRLTHDVQLRGEERAIASRLRKEPLEGSPSGPSERGGSLDREGTELPDSLGEYLAEAMRSSPSLQAAFERYRASVARIAGARSLPEPTLSFGYFIRSVETRVGPQRARIGLSQTFPWPGRLSAAARAASERAAAAEKLFDALTLRIRSRVVHAYFRVWLIRKLRGIHAEHLDVVRSLSESILVRVETGAASLADQQQVELSRARLADLLAGMDEQEVAALSELRAAMGVRLQSSLPTPQAPAQAGLPGESERVLAQAAMDHPVLASLEHQAQAEDETARSRRAEGYPSFSLGADWIITDQADAASVEHSGRDAVMVGGGVSLPLWGSYAENADAARAEARAVRAQRLDQENQILADLQATLSQVRDAARRVELYGQTLVPQAQSAYASVLGSYVAGRGTVAQTLLAQKDLLDLREQKQRARVDHALAWARLEELVGRSVEARSTSASANQEGQLFRDEP